MAQPAWTYSGLDTFATCPKKYYHLKVAKDTVDPPTEHTEWGQRVHDAMEYRIKEGRPLPEGMTQWETLAGKIAALPGTKLTEQKYSVDRNFQPTEWGAAWSRGIADLVVLHRDEAIVADYKTGKRKPSEQLDLYAAYVFAYVPNIQTVRYAYIWLKDKALDKTTVTKEELPALQDRFREKARRLESAFERDSWPAKPSGLCKAWCPVTTCEFNGKKNNKVR